MSFQHRTEDHRTLGGWRLWLLSAIAVFAGGLPAWAQADEHPPGHDHSAHANEPEFVHDTARRTQPWDKETVELFGSLPVQHLGRIKPLRKLAGLNLLVLNGKRTLKISEDEKLNQTEWLLDCFFFPEMAKGYDCFRVQNDSVLDKLGMDTQNNDKRKSDRYSYNDLKGLRMELMQRAQRISETAPKDQTPVEAQTLKLAGDMRKFENLIDAMEPVRWRYSTSGTPELDELFDAETSTLSTILSHSVGLMRLWRDANGVSHGKDDPLQRILSQLDSVLERGQGGVSLMPPPVDFEDQDTWWRIYDLVRMTFEAGADNTQLLPVLVSLERMEDAKEDAPAFLAALKEMHTSTKRMAEARGEYSTIPMEVTLENRDPFTVSLVFYLLAFLLVAVNWMVPKNRWLGRVVWGLTVAALGFSTWGIVMRCIIRSRPPVVSLYDTVLFVTCTCVFIALFAEWLTRQRAALGIAAFLGLAGMFLAGKYEFKEIASSGDTMASVVAVLDTNYYLAIHVTAITMGYAGGLLAAAIAHVWIIGKLLRFREGDAKFYKTIIRMTYGVLCFSLLFSIFGTIMGGVWANDSWGRFWGWDPKENGALLICIWSLLILHMRMGGFIRDRGFAVMTVLGGPVVAASWWGVNLLGVGLHSYGFTSGTAMTLAGYWAIEALVVALSGLDTVIRRKPQMEVSES